MPLIAHIDLGALRHNWLSLARRSAPARAAAVVKANGYGLGAAEIARTLAKAGARRFYVAWPAEGAELRAALGPEPEIAIFHGPDTHALKLFAQANLQPVINSLEQLALWRAHAADWPYALHVETGMNRLGIPPDRWSAAAQASTSPTHVLSHLACADERENPLNQLQLKRFQEALLFWPSAMRSLSATAGIYLGAQYHFDEVRPGIGVYGGGPSVDSDTPPKAVLRLLASVLQVRHVESGTAVGYGASWVAAAPSRVAIVGAGYGDGFLRSASGKGFVSVHGRLQPIVGRVSMNLIAVDVTGLEVVEGDQVELLGPTATIGDQAIRMSTIDYELLTRLGHRAARIYSGAPN